MWVYPVFFIIAAFISYIVAIGVRHFAIQKHIVDDPDQAPERKNQTHAIPLLGGWGVMVAIVVTICLSLLATRLLIDSFLSLRQIIGICLGALLIMIGGTIDDLRKLSPSRQLILPILAAIVVIVFGIGVPFITLPFFGVIQLDTIQIPLLTLQGVTYSLVVFADLFTFVWLLGLMYATKLLDGVDGLCSGIGWIGSLLMTIVSLTQVVNQPGTALLASIFAGAFFGFWIMNKVPAKMYLGEGGSLLVGFLLGLLAIISGAKIATALLILAFPLLDVLWVIIARARNKQGIFHADRRHLHFRLLDKGWSAQRVVFVFYIIAIIFGLSTLFFDPTIKMILLGAALLLSLGVLLYASRRHILTHV